MIKRRMEKDKFEMQTAMRITKDEKSWWADGLADERNSFERIVDERNL